MNKMFKRFLIFLGVLFITVTFGLSIATPVNSRLGTHGLSMYGDMKYGPDFEHFEYVNPNAPKGGSVKLATIGTFDSLNPFILKGLPAAGVGLLFETLTVNSQDEPFTVYGLLAETIKTDQNRSWVEFTLRKEAKWHDGTPVTVFDVGFSFDTLMEKGHPFYRYYYANVTKYEISSDKRTIRFIFDQPNQELPLIMGQLPIVQKTYYSNYDFAKTSLEFPVGSGPYKIVNMKSGRSITYEIDPNYWGKDIPVMKGMYNFDQIKYIYYRDETVALEAFKSGDYDFRMENTSKVWATAYKGKPFKKGKIIKEEVPNENPTGMQCFAFNIRKEIFKDDKVRLAITHLFDFEWTNKNLFYGAYTRTESYFSNSELASTGKRISYEEAKLLEPFKNQLDPMLHPSIWTDEYHPPQTDGTGNIRGNMELALYLLAKAGWYRQGDKLYKDVVDEEGNLLTIPFEFELLLVNPGFERVATPFKQNLEKVGIKMEIRLVDSAQYVNRLHEFDYDMIVASFGQSLSPGNEQRSFWSSDAANQQGSRNYIGIQNPAVDYLVDKIIEARSREELITACRALDRVLLWSYYVIPHWHINVYRIAYWDMFGRPEIKPKYALGFVDTWHVDEDKIRKLKRK
jgi:microcin C transport system substrate-binding protein